VKTFAQQDAASEWLTHALGCGADWVQATQVGEDVHVEARRGRLWREVVLGEFGGVLNDSGWTERLEGE
jgi:hypothetical protein